ncbi:MAG TPA: SurA N-terminal domain-containing protein [Candidatus Limnocylindria bacterium]|nr:SurA N-terminal domain-containing protein [Candidatus Limnocylindria bacterium]
MIPERFTPVLVLLLLLAAFASTAGARVVDGVVAVVNDEPITFSEFRESVAEGLGIPEGDADIYLREEKDRDRVLIGLEALIEMTLVHQELGKIGQPVSDAEVDRAIESVRKSNDMSESVFQAALEQEGISLAGYRRRIRWQMERGAIVRAKKLKDVTVTEEETRAYFQEHAERFLVGAEVRLEILTIPFPDEEAGTDNGVRTRIGAQEASAYVRSGMTFAEASGLLSSVVPGVTVFSADFEKTEDLLPEIGKEVVRLRTGETSPPFFTEAGAHLVKVLERRGGTLVDISDVKASLREEMLDRRSEKAFSDILVELKKAATIDIRL